MIAILGVPGIEKNFFTLTLLLQNVTNALANGAVYALMALTVVMIYKTTGHLNFAQGEMAMFSTFVVYVLAIEQGLNVWLAIAVVVIGSMVVGAAVERVLIQPLESRSVLAPVILTLGLFFILNGGAATIWGTQPKTPIPAPFPGHLDDKIDIITNRLPNFFITYKAIGVWATVLVLVVVLNVLLKRTKLGLAYRAVAANAESSLIVGIPVKRMLMLGWALAAGIGAIAGAIIAQYRNVLDFNFMAAVLLFGFAAACVGGFDSVKGAVVGGLLVGIVETFTPALFTFVGSELSLVMVLLVILIVLYFRPQGLFGSKRVERV
ncbi:MAG TPA: branched-chain amino acid ABC transporter permease [Ilumatobacteraceae bacterium]|nr:branched-chain amino acid ABC transporter permease [Ilumatobacteraceae bacterium]